MLKEKLIIVCPKCYGKNVVPRFGEGTDEWFCKDCEKGYYSVFELTKKEIEKLKKFKK